MLQSLALPGLVRCHRAFRFLGLCILELERVAGRTLEEELAEGRTYGEEEALAIVLQVARTLEGLREAAARHPVRRSPRRAG